jgi:hypothetical protein
VNIVSYDALSRGKQAQVDTMMGQDSDQWPPAFLSWLNGAWEGPRRGEGLVCAMATWVAALP